MEKNKNFTNFFKILLTLSLAINFIIIGAIGGAFWRFHNPPHSSKIEKLNLQYTPSIYFRALDKEQRKELSRFLRDTNINKNQVSLFIGGEKPELIYYNSNKEIFEQTLNILKGDDLNKKIFNALMQEQISGASKQRESYTLETLKFISNMNISERKDYAYRLEKILNKRLRRSSRINQIIN